MLIFFVYIYTWFVNHRITCQPQLAPDPNSIVQDSALNNKLDAIPIKVLALGPPTSLDLHIPYFIYTYCWWTKSCTTKDDDYPIIYRVKKPSQVVSRILSINSIFLQIDWLDVFKIILNPTVSLQRCWNLVVVLAWYPLQPSWVREPRMFRKNQLMFKRVVGEDC